jgi:hypothetical protein
MKYLLLVLMNIAINGTLQAQTIKNDTAAGVRYKPTSLVTGQAIDLDNYAGKKLLYIVLPITPDTAVTNQVERFQKKFSDKVVVLGLVNLEGKAADTITRQYSKLVNAGMLLSEGLKRRKAGSTQRTSVIEWICEKRSAAAENEQKEIGSKYFISEDGRLYAMLGADVPLDSPLMPSIVNTTVAKAIYQEDPSITPGKGN